MSKILHLLTAGGVGGIEVLCRDIGKDSNFHNGFCFVFGEGKIYEQMKVMNFTVYSLCTNRKISIRKLKRLMEIARQYDVIMVHHDDPFLEFYYLVLKAFYSEKTYISVVHHCHEPEDDRQKYNFIKLYLKKQIVGQMFKHSDRIVFVSKNGYQSYLPDYSIDEKKVSIIYNGISREFLNKGMECEKVEGQCIRILYVGRLVPLKCVDNLILAFSKLSKKNNIVLQIVGEGSERKKLEQMVKDLDIEELVCFYGFQEDVTPFLQEGDIFVYPSRTEIFGISIVEAMAFGNICVASNVGGIPEIVKDDKNGYLNFTNSTDGLIEAIEKAVIAYNNKEKRKKMCEYARKTASTFSIEKTIANLEKICQM